MLQNAIILQPYVAECYNPSPVFLPVKTTNYTSPVPDKLIITRSRSQSSNPSSDLTDVVEVRQSASARAGAVDMEELPWNTTNHHGSSSTDDADTKRVVIDPPTSSSEHHVTKENTQHSSEVIVRLKLRSSEEGTQNYEELQQVADVTKRTAGAHVVERKKPSSLCDHQVIAAGNTHHLAEVKDQTLQVVGEVKKQEKRSK